MNIIFLDVDGVLNCSADFGKTEPTYAKWTVIEPSKLERILLLQKEFDAKIVLSSSWRNTEAGQKELNAVGINWVSVTPEGGTRASQINAWLLENEFEGNFVVIDDDSSPEEHLKLQDKFVKTKFSEGFQDQHLELARKILSKGKWFWSEDPNEQLFESDVACLDYWISEGVSIEKLNGDEGYIQQSP